MCDAPSRPEGDPLGTEAKASGHGASIAGTTVGEEEGVQEARGMSTEAKAY